MSWPIEGDSQCKVVRTIKTAHVETHIKLRDLFGVSVGENGDSTIRGSGAAHHPGGQLLPLQLRGLCHGRHRVRARSLPDGMASLETTPGYRKLATSTNHKAEVLFQSKRSALVRSGPLKSALGFDSQSCGPRYTSGYW